MTPLPVLGRGIPHQLRAVSPMTQTGGDFQAESAELNDSSTVSSEPPDSDTSCRDGGTMRHLLTMELRPRLRPGLLRASLERTCQDRAMVTRFGRKGRERKPGRSTGKRQRADQCDRACEGGRKFMHYWQRKTQAVNPLRCRIAFSRRQNRDRHLSPLRVRQFTLVFGQRRCKRTLMD